MSVSIILTHFSFKFVMDHMLLISLITAVVWAVHCNGASRSKEINELTENENCKINEAILRRLEALETQHRDIVENSRRNDHLNDTSDLEDRVHALELGLAAVVDDLDELEESQVTNLYFLDSIVLSHACKKQSLPSCASCAFLCQGLR